MHMAVRDLLQIFLQSTILMPQLLLGNIITIKQKTLKMKDVS